MYTEKYKRFFQETDEGKYLLKELDGLVDNAHKSAEQSEDMQVSFGFMKEAAGIRRAIRKINSLQMEAKLPMQ